jgi:tRNA U55 pseudouridine synthase TruB
MLRRLQVGWFSEADALSLDSDAATAQAKMLPMWQVLQSHAPIRVSDEEADRLLQGQRIPIPLGAHDDRGEIVIMDNAGRLMAVTKIVDDWLWPRKVLALD